MPFGISGFTPEIGNKKWNVDFSMRGFDESDGIIKKCYDVLREIEDKIINRVAEQSQDIFGKNMTYEELRPLFNSNIKETPGREPKFRVKVDTDFEGKLNRYLRSRKEGYSLCGRGWPSFTNYRFGYR